ncbi:uncharacterized protein AAG666_017288 [Megaptera novaeangliae]
MKSQLMFLPLPLVVQRKRAVRNGKGKKMDLNARSEPSRPDKAEAQVASALGQSAPVIEGFSSQNARSGNLKQAWPVKSKQKLLGGTSGKAFQKQLTWMESAFCFSSFFLPRMGM